MTILRILLELIVWCLFGFICSFGFTLDSYALNVRHYLLSDSRGRCSKLFDTSSANDIFASENDDFAKSHHDICIIGGGISGLTAAITAASSEGENPSKKRSIILFESQPQPGGRVSSEYINGFTLDKGYAVFVEKYPQAINLFDFDALDLKQYDPGALIKRKGSGFARISDPLRQPSKLVGVMGSPVGRASDKVRLLPLFYHVKTRTVEELFEEEEVDTLSCLKNKYKFSDKMIREFFEPFLRGIYFCPLNEQSSRMFHFVFKMFADGAASLPTGGMQAVSNQLMEKAMSMGVDIQLNHSVEDITLASGEEGGRFQVRLSNGINIHSKSVICATEEIAARKILSSIKGLESLALLEKQPQRSVGCIYYTFSGDTPVKDAVLILNGEGSGPCLTVSFLHVVNESYAPRNCGICSVAIPADYMEKYEDRQEELDGLVRHQLATWWSKHSKDIQTKWKLEKIYNIKYAQPAQYNCQQPANAHGGREPSKIHGVQLPKGLYVCGDYMATATLNGAIESGVKAAKIANEFLEN